jgi:hypothetical protein
MLHRHETTVRLAVKHEDPAGSYAHLELTLDAVVYWNYAAAQGHGDDVSPDPAAAVEVGRVLAKVPTQPGSPECQTFATLDLTPLYRRTSVGHLLRREVAAAQQT